MTNEELCKALRSALWGQGHHINIKAADRIEALLNLNEALVELMDDRDAKLAKAVEVLRVLIQHAHNCEKELTEELHHQDFCGESLPLTDARAVLAEIEGGKG
jgi:hypothetical protein